MKALVNSVRAFAREEDGVALTEYLILLGLLVGGVVASVLTIGGELNTAWASWATWFQAQTLTAPAATPTP
ncbi:hypothetical protein N2599_29960 (plasmid) [Rhizobium sullae]|uniref:Flp family type IVb pilin n=1 Tax=Rhizobium sullae TaxID=50338 RepID=A0ABY5XQZ2_RHISU|nr:hypothetical protein [Rhizobium sullae]UWU17027.1 hypothetical protein N2599_29960 [Rhizobium sullae]